MKKFLISAAILAMSLSMAFTISAYHREFPEGTDQQLSEYFATAEVLPAITVAGKFPVTDYPFEPTPDDIELIPYAYDPAVSDVYYEIDWDTYLNIVMERAATAELVETTATVTDIPTWMVPTSSSEYILHDIFITNYSGLFPESTKLRIEKNYTDMLDLDINTTQANSAVYVVQTKDGYVPYGADFVSDKYEVLEIIGTWEFEGLYWIWVTSNDTEYRTVSQDAAGTVYYDEFLEEFLKPQENITAIEVVNYGENGYGFEEIVYTPDVQLPDFDFSKVATDPVTKSLGDFYIDGSAGLNDVILFGKYLGGKADFTDTQKISADVYADGVLNANDLIALIKYSFGEIDSLPVVPTV